MVSVCMATYNGEKFVRKQIESILCQIGEEDELVISDDCSTDSTVAIIQSIGDKRIKIYNNKKFANPSRNFENAISLSKGELIFLCDQDDLWLAGKYAVMKDILQNRADVVVSDCEVINESGGIVARSFFELNGSRHGIIRNFIKNGHLGCCMAFSRRILKKALPFPEDVGMHDIWLGMIGEVYFKTVFIKQNLIQYRRHSANFSNATNRSKNSFIKKIDLRIRLFLRLVQRAGK